MSDKELELLIKEKEARKLELSDKLKSLEKVYNERLSIVNNLKCEILELDSKILDIIPKTRKKAFISSDHDLDIQVHTQFIESTARKDEIQLLLAEAMKDLNRSKDRFDEVSGELKKMMLQQDKISEIVEDRKVLEIIIKSEVDNED